MSDTSKPKPCMYQIKSGIYAGMYHVRAYEYLGEGKGRYFHIGRYWTLEEALQAQEDWVRRTSPATAVVS